MRPSSLFILIFTVCMLVALSSEDSEGATPSTSDPTRVVLINQPDDVPDIVIAEQRYHDASDLTAFKVVQRERFVRVTYRINTIPDDAERVSYDVGFLVKRGDQSGSVLSFLSGEARMLMGDASIAWVCNGSKTVTDMATGIVKQTIPLRCLPKRASILPVIRYYVYTPKLGYWSLVGSDSFQVWTPVYTFR